MTQQDADISPGKAFPLPQGGPRGRSPLKRIVLAAIALLIVFAVPGVALGQYGTYVWTLALIYILPVAGLNLMLGYAGQMSLAQGAFLGVGAYSVALLQPTLSFWGSLLVAVVAGFVIGGVLGLTAIRVKHYHLAMVTLAFNVIFVLLVSNQSATGGALGILNIDRPRLGSLNLDSALGYMLLVACIVVIALVVLFAFLSTPWGRGLRAIRENELRAAAVGVRVSVYKVVAFAVGCALAAIGGALLAPLLGFLAPTAFTDTVSVQFLIMVVIGGLGRFEGAIVGAAIVVVLPELFRFSAGLFPFIIALATLLILLFEPEGVLGIVDGISRRVFKRPLPRLTR